MTNRYTNDVHGAPVGQSWLIVIVSCYGDRERSYRPAYVHRYDITRCLSLGWKCWCPGNDGGLRWQRPRWWWRRREGSTANCKDYARCLCIYAELLSAGLYRCLCWFTLCAICRDTLSRNYYSAASLSSREEPKFPKIFTDAIRLCSRAASCAFFGSFVTMEKGDIRYVCMNFLLFFFCAHK